MRTKLLKTSRVPYECTEARNDQRGGKLADTTYPEANGKETDGGLWWRYNNSTKGRREVRYIPMSGRKFTMGELPVFHKIRLKSFKITSFLLSLSTECDVFFFCLDQYL